MTAGGGATEHAAAGARGILLFDGGCPLCRRSVRLLIALDRRRRALRFAPLGGPTAAQLLGTVPPPGGGETVVFAPSPGSGDGHLRFRSAALVAALEAVGGFWALAARALRWLPAGFRDALYDAVARRRRRDPARAARCLLPAPGESDRFLP